MLAAVFKPRPTGPHPTGLHHLLNGDEAATSTPPPTTATIGLWHVVDTQPALALWQHQHPTVKALMWQDNLMPHEARRLLAEALSPHSAKPLLLTLKHWLSAPVQQALRQHLSDHPAEESHPVHHLHVPTEWWQGMPEDPEAYQLLQQVAKQWDKLAVKPVVLSATPTDQSFTTPPADPMVFWGLSDHHLLRQLQSALRLIKQGPNALTGWFNTGVQPLEAYTLAKIEQAIEASGWHVCHAHHWLNTPLAQEEALSKPAPWTMVLAQTPPEQAYYPLWLHHVQGQPPTTSLSIQWQEPITPHLPKEGLHWVCHSKENYNDRLAALRKLDPRHGAIPALKHHRHHLIQQHRPQSPWLPSIVQEGLNHLLY
jgi:hypothetical protein